MGDCNCKCKDPKKLKDNPENCTSEEIKKCHGKKGHPCACNTDEKKKDDEG